jgi:hypothetical protein
MDKITIKTIMQVKETKDNKFEITFTVGQFPNRFSAGVFAANLLMAKEEMMDENENKILTNRTLH